MIDDISEARKLFATGLTTMVGDEYRQRRTFEMLMPELEKMRGIGMSFRQISECIDTAGLSLGVSTVRAYYFEMIASQLIRHNGILQTAPNSDAQSEPDKHTSPAVGADGLRCLPLQPTAKQIDRRNGVPEAVYEEGLLEHPAIQGLMLTKAERLYSSDLEIIDVDGRERFETPHERRFRIKWQKPVIQTPTSTSKDFVKMNPSLFKRH